MRALRWILAFACLLAASPGLVVAQDGGAPDETEEPPSDIERARDHMERGQALYLQARFEEAAAEFEAAYEAQPFSAFLFNAGVALERAGQPNRAADYFEQYLERDPSAADSGSVRERIDRLRASAQAAAAPPVGQTTEGQTPEGQTAEGRTPEGQTAEGRTPEGQTAEGRTPEGQTTEGQTTEGQTTEGQTAEGQTTTSEGQTAQRQAPPPDGIPEDFKSLLSVRTNPEGATIRVQRGGETVAEGPAPFASTLDQGRYHVLVEHPDYQTVEQDVRIEPGKVYVVIVEMSQGQFLGYLRVTSNVAGADVYVDDREQGPRGRTPFETPIPIGTHQIWVERPGYQVEESEIEIGIGEDITARIDLTRVDYGRLRVVANVSGARVLVDGQQLGTVPFEGQVSAGPHRVTIDGAGMKAFETEVTIRRGQLTPVRARLRPAVDRGSAWVTTVFSALFLGGGIAAGVISNDIQNELRVEQQAGTLAADDSRFDTGLYLSIGADAGFGLSLVLGCLALYYFIYDPLPPSEGTVLEARDWAFAPMVDPVQGAAGLGFQGRF